MLIINPPEFVKKAALFFKRHRLLARALSLFLALLILFSLFYTIFQDVFKQIQYQLSPKAQALIIRENSDLLGRKLAYSTTSASYEYNQDYKPTNGEVAGQIAGPKFSASFKENARQGMEITDPYSQTTIKLVPDFLLGAPNQEENRLVYPLLGKKGAKIITLGVAGLKEDIILEEFVSDTMKFEYKLEMPSYLEARLESNGSIVIYGPEETSLMGNVSTSTEEDAKLLEKARQNANKTKTVFTIPAPYIKESNSKTPTYSASFKLQANKITLEAYNLRDLRYPISIDPTIYIETAAKLMRGNNETNTDFDVDNELIQKSQTTGARIDAWQGNLDQSEGTWGQATAATGGYVYRTGGATGVSKPQVVSQETTAEATADTSFQMNMPAIRPAGDLYIAVMCHDDGADTVTAPAGWTEYADTREFAAYYKVGTDEGGGNEAASYTWTISSNEAKAGSIIRVTGFNAIDPVAGTPGTGSNGSSVVPEFPATTPDNDATLVIRAVGADNDIPSDTGWIPSGHTKIASGESGGGGGNRCGFVAAALDTPPASGVSSGTATLADSNITAPYGAASIAINPSSTTPPPQIEDSATTVSGGSDTTSFQMNMPATRPAGDLYIALMCHDGTGTISTVPSGWTKVSANDTDEFDAFYKIGTNVSGGNEAATYTWGGINEEWAGVIIRVSGFDSTDIFSGTPGTTNTNGTPGTFPATTPDNNNTLVIRAIGGDNDDPTTGSAWVPAGHSRIASDTSSNTTGDCGFVAAQMTNSPASGVSTGTVNMGNNWLNGTYGGITFAINPEPSSGFTESVRSNVNWAKFDSDTLAIESPNPGTGPCSGWCTNSSYNLPEGRRGHSMVAYNGFLYVVGGLDSSGTRSDKVFIAKLGANGEPSLWSPTSSDPNDWEYWHESEKLLPAATSYAGLTAYNNRLYLLGGQTNAATTGTTNVYIAELNPTGDTEDWTGVGSQSLPAGAGRYMHTVQVYNNTLYTIGGFEGAITSSANLRSSVYYSRLDSDGSMNAWTATSSFSSARASYGGAFSTIWGAYIYLGGGCSAVNGSGYCTTVSGDMQIASINADGTLSAWGSLGTLDNTRIGYSLLSWQGGLYRLGGCTSVNSSNGYCSSVLADVDYGVINPAGEVSTVNISVPSGTAPCNGGSPTSCDLPTVGDDAGEIGHMLNMTTVLNGYLYVIGGCAEYNCNDGTNSPSTDNISDNTAYVAINPDGSLVAPPSCAGTSYGSWCIDSTNTINGTDGVAAAGIATFNNRIYVLGGIDSTGNVTGELYYNSVNPTTGALSGGWTAQTLSSVGITENIFYTFIYARANPAQAGTYDGNLYVFGGCGNGGSGAGCGASDYETEVYKCWIEDGGAIENTAGSATYDCTTSGQLQIDSTPGTGGTDGLGIHSGTVYANYIYLIGGFSQAESDKDDVIYARFDNNNNVVAVSGGTWIESPNKLSTGRRRGWAFGYNGHIYAVGGYDDSGTGIIPFIEWSKMNVSDGSIDTFVTSSVTINQRWGLSMVVSNSYAYVIGGCDVGASPSNCSSFEPAVQTFQLYNNNSGALNNFTAQADQTFATNTDRIGAASTVHNGYIYVVGGCTNISCTTVSDNVQYAQLSADDGTVGTWSNTNDDTLTNSANGRAWGTLEVAGGTLYYMGGQDSTGDEKLDVYYATPSSSSGNIFSWNGASNDLPADRTQHGSAVWNNRLYVVGGLNDSGSVTNTVYVSPQLNSGGNIGSAWSTTTAFNVARTGLAVTAYANNLYLFGGFDGTNYLSDTQFTQINSDGTVDAWTYGTSLPFGFRDSSALSYNGYVYLVGGRTAATTCNPKVLITPISANTTIASGNNPTGVGEWYETNVRYSGDRYGAAVAYDKGKIYTMGGGCSSILSSNRHYYSTVLSQPQVAQYSRMIDTDTNVFPNAWLMNGLDNSIGARWQVNYRSAADGLTGGTNIVFDENFDAGSDGTSLNIGSDYVSCYGNSSSATPQFDNVWSVSGGLSAKFEPLNGTGDTGCYNDFSEVSTRFERFYFRLTDNPTNNSGFYHVSNTSAGENRVAEIQFGSSGQLRLRDQFTLESTFTTPICTDALVTAGTDPLCTVSINRLETGIYGDTMYVRLYKGSNANGVVPNETRSITLDLAAYDSFHRFNIGMLSDPGAARTLWIDDHKAAIDNWVGSADPSAARWGQQTNYGDVTLGDVAPYNLLDANGDSMDFARWYYFFVSIDASKTFGYPEDVNRGPTIWDLSLFFTADPSKRLRHGKTFTGGEQQPLDTPCRQNVDNDCPLPAP